ncbi:hypothetical protein [Jeotgalibacillus terrae]|uniref:Uncharacterized protein n=1 Tax=Jeotgalibacillus terrae TaxID=587735 RepID=A0ABW5ZHX1_9BACL|nr:hypothetical protein [Jeotgalibacillus terrae]MBM7580590.1 hypothetical protein [Jeotgalibacillus terrae]
MVVSASAMVVTVELMVVSADLIAPSHQLPKHRLYYFNKSLLK